MNWAEWFLAENRHKGHQQQRQVTKGRIRLPSCQHLHLFCVGTRAGQFEFPSCLLFSVPETSLLVQQPDKGQFHTSTRLSFDSTRIGQLSGCKLTCSASRSDADARRNWQPALSSLHSFSLSISCAKVAVNRTHHSTITNAKPQNGPRESGRYFTCLPP
jgi:hypothetical protein